MRLTITFSSRFAVSSRGIVGNTNNQGLLLLTRHRVGYSLNVEMGAVSLASTEKDESLGRANGVLRFISSDRHSFLESRERHGATYADLKFDLSLGLLKINQ